MKKLFCFIFCITLFIPYTKTQILDFDKDITHQKDNSKAILIQQAVNEFFSLLETNGKDLFNTYDKSDWLNHGKIKQTEPCQNLLLPARIAALVYDSNYKFFLQKLKNDETRKNLENALKNIIEKCESPKIKTFVTKINDTKSIVLQVMKDKKLQNNPDIRKFFTKQAFAIFKILVKIFDDAKIDF